MATLPSTSNPLNWGTTYNNFLEIEHDGDTGSHLRPSLINTDVNGCVGNGIAIDTTAINACIADGYIYTKHDQTYLTTLADYDAITVNCHGRSQIETALGKLPFEHRHISARPSDVTTANTSYNTAFNGDFSEAGHVTGMVISGTALGTPDAGGEYLLTPETCAYYTWVHMAGGSNPSADNSRRTGYVLNKTYINHAGDGDAIHYNAQVYVTNGDSGSHTSFLSSPAGVLYGGRVQSTVNYTNLTWGESNINDGGFICRGTGPVINFTRDNNDETKDEFWNGLRYNSNGDYAVNAGLQLLGKWDVGLDLSMMTTGTVAAALKANQVIDFHTSASVNAGISNIARYADTFNQWSIGYKSAATAGLQFLAGGTQGLLMTAANFVLGRGVDDPNYLQVFGASTRSLDMGISGTAGFITAASDNGSPVAEATSIQLRAQNASGTISTVATATTNGITYAGSEIHTVQTLAATATPSVATGRVFKTNGATAITNFSGGTEGQIITIVCDTTGIDITDNATILLAGGNYGMTDTDTLQLVLIGTEWHELSRSVN